MRSLEIHVLPQFLRRATISDIYIRENILNLSDVRVLLLIIIVPSPTGNFFKKKSMFGVINKQRRKNLNTVTSTYSSKHPPAFHVT